MAEALISFGLMLTVLFATNTPRLMRLTGVFAGVLVASYITFEAPLSGMSMNPARTLASALPGELWQGLWIYFVGPIAGMLLAVEAYRRIRRTPAGRLRQAQPPHPAPLHLPLRLRRRRGGRPVPGRLTRPMEATDVQ